MFVEKIVILQKHPDNVKMRTFSPAFFKYSIIKTYLADVFLELRPVFESFRGFFTALVTPACPRVIRRSTASVNLV